MLIYCNTTVVVGMITLIFMPDKAKSKWYRLTLNEINIVEDRMHDTTIAARQNNNAMIKTQHILEVLQGTRCYCYMIICFLVHLINGCVSVFTTTIINSMSFTVRTLADIT